MLLARELVDYVSRQIVKRMSPLWIESTDPYVAELLLAALLGTALIGAARRPRPELPS